MRSSQLAELAGITRRTLRHYHQVGVLAEPPRSDNGYRDYPPEAVVTILRVRRLQALGLSLVHIAEILDGSRTDPRELYAHMDAELAVRIEQLTRQREHIAHLQHYGAPPDLPLHIAAPHDMLRRYGLPDDAAAVDRDHALLLSQILGPQGQAYMVAVYQLISSPDRAQIAAEVMVAWAELGDDVDGKQMDQLVEQIVTLFAPILATLQSEEGATIPALSDQQITEYGTAHLNTQQMRVLRGVREELEHPPSGG